MVSARGLVVGVTLTLGLLSSLNAMELAPSVAGQPMATATPPCPTMDPQYVYVEPVISPTDLLTQTITARLDYAVWIKVLAESGTFTMTQSTSGHSVVMRLLPDVTHHLEVTGRWQFRADCPWFTTQTNRDRNGDPLIIVQGDPPRPTATPTPQMLRNVNVFGIVIARETPVSTRILLHPSDGRCPWSDGYRSGADGSFALTCSDARLGSEITVLTFASTDYRRWMDSFTVQKDEHGAIPIEVRIELTPWWSGGPTPTPTPSDGFDLRVHGHVRGTGRGLVTWAHVSVDGSYCGGECLGPVYTDDSGGYEQWCFGASWGCPSLRLQANAAGYEPWMQNLVANGPSLTVDIDLVALAGTATPTPGGPPNYLPIAIHNMEREALATPVTAAPPTAMETPTTTATSTPIRTRTATAAPTETANTTPTPTVTATPSPDTYFFLESWTHAERGPGCGMFFIDFPTYSFNDSTGALHVYGGNPRLQPSDLGYVGSGSSLSGRGSGAASRLSAFHSTPFVPDNLELRSIDGSGSVTLKRGTEVIELESGVEWRRTWSRESPGEPGCVVTDTHRISNYGLQDRRKIVYSAASADARTRQARARSRAHACE